jgi:hypothetical protein
MGGMTKGGGTGKGTGTGKGKGKGKKTGILDLLSWQAIDYAEHFVRFIPLHPLPDDLFKLVGKVIPAAMRDVWVRAYANLGGSPELVNVDDAGFTYCFDKTAERVVAVYGTVAERTPGKRDSSRLAGFPKSTKELSDKGHLIAHRLGGGLDINLIHQLATVNRGEFRTLEKEAAKNPGAFYFVRLLYSTPSLHRNFRAKGKMVQDAQRPDLVEQGLVLPRLPLETKVTTYQN